MKTLSIDEIRIDGGTQTRESLSQSRIDDYAELYQDKAKLPPVSVMFDGAAYWLVDGFHRWHACRKAGLGKIPAEIANGTQRDAILKALGANATHGLPRSDADKRKSVRMALADKEWSKKSSRWIAEQCGVSHTFVDKLRQAESANNSEKSSGNVATTKPGKTSTKNGTLAQDVRTGGEKPKQYNDSFDPKQLESDDSGSAKPSEKCPSCKAKKWAADGDSWKCGKCGHFCGEPVGDVDDDALKMQKSKTVKTLEAAVRAFDDLQGMSTSRKHSEAVESCKALIEIAKGWT